jgi:hypothetical protein
VLSAFWHNEEFGQGPEQVAKFAEADECPVGLADGALA